MSVINQLLSNEDTVQSSMLRRVWLKYSVVHRSTTLECMDESIKVHYFDSWITVDGIDEKCLAEMKLRLRARDTVYSRDVVEGNHLTIVDKFFCATNL